MPDLFGRSGIRGGGHSSGGGGNSLFSNGGFGFHVSLDMFFDRAGIIAKMDEKTNKVLSNTGAFARTVMQRGMKYRKSPSPVGGYPSAHRGNPLLREKIRFGYDEATKSVVIGPALLDKTDKEVAAAGKTVPELINYGGVVMRRKVYDPKLKQIRHLHRTQKPIPWHYGARPFAELTLPIASKKLAENMEKFDLK